MVHPSKRMVNRKSTNAYLVRHIVGPSSSPMFATNCLELTFYSITLQSGGRRGTPSTPQHGYITSVPLCISNVEENINLLSTDDTYSDIIKDFKDVFKPELRLSPGAAAKHGVQHFIKTTGPPYTRDIATSGLSCIKSPKKHSQRWRRWVCVLKLPLPGHHLYI